MDKNNAYTIGYICGTADKAVSKMGGDTPTKSINWAVRPWTCLTETLARANQRGALTPEVDAAIADAMARITGPGPDEGAEEKALPPAIQTIFQRGYYAGIRGESLPAPVVPLADRRKAKGMTQGELADALGVARSTVTHWERGITVPVKYRDKLEELLK